MNEGVGGLVGGEGDWEGGVSCCWGCVWCVVWRRVVEGERRT